MESRERKLARREQIERDFTNLNQSIEKWLREWRDRDEQQSGRYQTQVKSIETTLRGVSEEFRVRLARVSAEATSGQLYDECRNLSQASVWLERLWEFIRLKLDQRLGDDKVARLLQAADEVVWSCYRAVIKQLPAGHPAAGRALVPLTYLEPEYSPAAAQFDRPPPTGLRFTSPDPTLGACLQNVPIPTVRLTPWCVSSPWWLVLIGHEVGHHIQHELGLVGEFARGMSAAARAAGLEEGSARRWEAWSEEIFADACSVFTIGPVAVRAITELEWSTPDALCQRKVNYPAPAIRIALMTQLAGRVGLDTSSLLKTQEWQEIAQSSAATREDWSVVDSIVDLITRPQANGLPPLQKLCGFEPADFDPRGRIAVWAEGLRGIGSLAPRRQTNDARHMASAAFSAWAALAGESEVARCEGLERLREKALKAMRDCGEEGKRGGPAVGVEIDLGAAKRIAAVLFDERSPEPS